MNKQDWTYVALALVGGAVLGGFLFSGKSVKQNFGGFLTTPTNATTLISSVATDLVAAGAGLQFIAIKNPGPGDVYCAFGATSTVNTGLYIASATSTQTSAISDKVISDPNLMGRRISCIGTATSTVTVLKY